jgi:DNA-binding HxlR family transcriptional regulator
MAISQRPTHCPACSGIEVLQDRWVLHIVRALLEGPKGFNAIGRCVGGCSPTTLTERLHRLEALGLIAKEGRQEPSCPERSGRCCYRLTDAGEKLDRVIEAIKGWAEQVDLVNGAEASSPPRDAHEQPPERQLRSGARA